MIKEDKRHSVKITEVTKGNWMVVLEINKPSEENKGSYKLVAKNEKGEAASETIQVDVDGKDLVQRISTQTVQDTHSVFNRQILSMQYSTQCLSPFLTLFSPFFFLLSLILASASPATKILSKKVEKLKFTQQLKETVRESKEWETE